MNSLPKTVTRQRHDCDMNPGPSVLESSTLTTRLPSHPNTCRQEILLDSCGCTVRAVLQAHRHSAADVGSIMVRAEGAEG